MVSIWGSCLKLLRVACASRYYMSSLSLSLPILMKLLPRGDHGLYLYLYLFHYACIFNSLGICAQILYDMPACSIHGGYVHKFCLLTLLDWCVAHAYIFNSCRICVQVAWCSNPRGSLKWRIHWDDEWLTRDYDLLRGFGDSQGSLLGM